MKIAIWHNLPSGGAKRALFYQVKGMLERGHQLEVWCPPDANRSYLPLNPLVTEHVLPLRKGKTGKMEGAKRLVQVYRGWLEQIQWMDEHCSQCAAEIHERNFDLFWGHACQYFAVTSIGGRVNLPRVLDLPEPYRRLYEAAPGYPWLALPPADRIWSLRYMQDFIHNLVKTQELRIQARQEHENIRAYDLVHVYSYFSRESMLRTYGLDARVCYCGIDIELFHDRHESREPFVVGVGSITRAKNIHFVIRSLGKLKPPRPPLVWIGNMANASYLASLKALAEKEGVEFIAKVLLDDQELVSLLNRASVMAYAPRLEPFGVAPLEANACGLPVVAVAEGGVRESIQDGVNGILVSHNDEQAFAGAIASLLENPGSARKLGRQGRELVCQHWTWSASLDRLEAIFHELLNIPGKRGSRG
jgi:glycosyltransferase involved in cell wall biosynthesis